MSRTDNKKNEFLKVAVKRTVKREIDMLAAHKQQPVYEVVGEAVEVYKLVLAGKLPAPADGVIVPVLEVISSH